MPPWLKNLLGNQVFGNCVLFYWPVHEVTIPVSLPCFLVTQRLPLPPTTPSPCPTWAKCCLPCRTSMLVSRPPGCCRSPCASAAITGRWAPAYWSIFQTRPGTSRSRDHILLTLEPLVASPCSVTFSARMVSQQCGRTVSAALLEWRLSMLVEIWLRDGEERQHAHTVSGWWPWIQDLPATWEWTSALTLLVV